MTPRHIRQIAAIACMGVWALPALGQQSWNKYQQVEAGSADVGPLRFSSRILPADLRAPTGFEKVYRVPGAATGVPSIEGANGNDRFARISGGLTAVFSRSEYLKVKKGTAVLIPAGTVFYIGGVPEAALGKPTAPASRATTASLRTSGLAPGTRIEPVDLRVHNEEEAGGAFITIRTRPDAPMPPANVLANDMYRKSRVRAMLMAAVQAGERGE